MLFDIQYLYITQGEAIEFHLEGMLEDGLALPQPTSLTHEVEILLQS
jgi:hypothetical protein